MAGCANPGYKKKQGEQRPEGHQGAKVSVSLSRGSCKKAGEKGKKSLLFSRKERMNAVQGTSLGSGFRYERNRE